MPLEMLYRYARHARFVDGADEVHREAVARQILKRVHRLPRTESRRSTCRPGGTRPGRSSRTSSLPRPSTAKGSAPSCAARQPSGPNRYRSRRARAPSRRLGTTRSCRTPRSMALVAPSGDVEWMCVPRPGLSERLRRDSRPRCGNLSSRARKHRRAGRAALPAGDDGVGDDLDDTHRLADRRKTRSSSGRGITKESVRATHRRVPTDHDAKHVLVRTMSCAQGSVELQLECEPELRLWAASPRCGNSRMRVTDLRLRQRRDPICSSG